MASSLCAFRGGLQTEQQSVSLLPGLFILLTTEAQRPGQPPGPHSVVRRRRGFCLIFLLALTS